MTIQINKAAWATYLGVIGLVVLYSARTNQQQIEPFPWEQFRFPAIESSPVAWTYSASMFFAMLMFAFLLYAFWLRAKLRVGDLDVIVDSYELATYKLISQEEYESLSSYIPQEVKDEVVREYGMKCFYTGKKLYAEPPNVVFNWIWKKTKNSELLVIRMLSLLFERNMLDFGHVIGRRLRGPNKKWNIRPEDRRHNRSSKHYLYGRKRKEAIKLARERGETIHRKALS